MHRFFDHNFSDGSPAITLPHSSLHNLHCRLFARLLQIVHIQLGAIVSKTVPADRICRGLKVVVPGGRGNKLWSFVRGFPPRPIHSIPKRRTRLMLSLQQQCLRNLLRRRLVVSGVIKSHLILLLGARSVLDVGFGARVILNI